MADQEALRLAFQEYKKKADRAKQARQEAKQARRLADRAEASQQQDAERRSTAAQKAESKADTAEKERHLAKLKTKDSHQPGEENGCVTRCIWEEARPPTWKRRCLFDGHNHKENAIKYHVANERNWYNLPFEVQGTRAQRRLQVHARAVNLSRKADKNNPIRTPGAWDMALSGDNFWSGPDKPWTHEAHHVIPTDVLYQAFKEELGLLQQLKYNINKGVNIIVLPKQEVYGRIYLLPAHTNSHKDYSTEVKSRVRAVRSSMGQEQEKTEGHPDTTDAPDNNWKAQLENHSKQLRKFLRRKGILLGLTPNESNALNDVFRPEASDAASA